MMNFITKAEMVRARKPKYYMTFRGYDNEPELQTTSIIKVNTGEELYEPQSPLRKFENLDDLQETANWIFCTNPRKMLVSVEKTTVGNIHVNNYTAYLYK